MQPPGINWAAGKVTGALHSQAAQQENVVGVVKLKLHSVVPRHV
jgi:hypothetical protein